MITKFKKNYCWQIACELGYIIPMTESQPYIIYKFDCLQRVHYEKCIQISIYEGNRFRYLKFTAHLCIYMQKCMHSTIQNECSYLIGRTASINIRLLMRIDSREISLQNQTFATSTDQIAKLVVQAENKSIEERNSPKFVLLWMLYMW